MVEFFIVVERGFGYYCVFGLVLVVLWGKYCVRFVWGAFVFLGDFCSVLVGRIWYSLFKVGGFGLG